MCKLNEIARSAGRKSSSVLGETYARLRPYYTRLVMIGSSATRVGCSVKSCLQRGRRGAEQASHDDECWACTAWCEQRQEQSVRSCELRQTQSGSKCGMLHSVEDCEGSRCVEKRRATTLWGRSRCAERAIGNALDEPKFCTTAYVTPTIALFPLKNANFWEIP